MRDGGQKVFDAAKTGKGDGFNDPAIIKAGEQLAELGKLRTVPARLSRRHLDRRRLAFSATARRP